LILLFSVVAISFMVSEPFDAVNAIKQELFND